MKQQPIPGAICPGCSGPLYARRASTRWVEHEQGAPYCANPQCVLGVPVKESLSSEVKLLMLGIIGVYILIGLLVWHWL